jgi:hypothetical protein
MSKPKQLGQWQIQHGILKKKSRELSQQEALSYTEAAKKEERIFNANMTKQEIDDVEKLAANLANPNADKTDNWKEGYLYAKETLYTEEDMIDAFYDGWLSKDLIWKVAKKLFKESLKESKK